MWYYTFSKAFKRREIASDAIGTWDKNGYVSVDNALKLLGFNTKQISPPYITVHDADLICVEDSVTASTVNDSREMAMSHNLIWVCIVSCYNDSNYITSKAKKLAKQYDIKIVNYNNVLDTVYNHLNREDELYVKKSALDEITKPVHSGKK